MNKENLILFAINVKVSVLMSSCKKKPLSRKQALFSFITFITFQVIYVRLVITVHEDQVTLSHVMSVNIVHMLVFKSRPVTVPQVSTVPAHPSSPTNTSVRKEDTVRKALVFRIFVQMEHSEVATGTEN